MIRRLIAHLRAAAWDLDMAGYLAALAALVALSGMLGPTLDRHDELAKDGSGKTAYAAKD